MNTGIQTHNPTPLTTASSQVSAGDFENAIVSVINNYIARDPKNHTRKIEKDLATKIKGTDETLGDYLALEKSATRKGSVRVKKFLSGPQNEQSELKKYILKAFDKNHGSSKHSSFTLSLKDAVAKNDALQEFTREHGKFKIATHTHSEQMNVPPLKPSLRNTPSQALSSKEVSLPKESSPLPIPAIATLQQQASAAIHSESEQASAQAQIANVQKSPSNGQTATVRSNVTAANTSAASTLLSNAIAPTSANPIERQDSVSQISVDSLPADASLQEKKAYFITKILNKYYNKSDLFKSQQKTLNKHFQNTANICQALNKAFPELKIHFDKNPSKETYEVSINGTVPSTDQGLKSILDLIEKGHKSASSLIEIIDANMKKPLWNDIKGGIVKNIKTKANNESSRYLVLSENEVKLVSEDKKNKEAIIRTKEAELHQESIESTLEDIKQYNILKNALSALINSSAPLENLKLVAERVQLITKKHDKNLTQELVNKLKNSSAKPVATLDNLIKDIPSPSFKDISYTPGDNLVDMKKTLEKERIKLEAFKTEYLSSLNSVINAFNVILAEKDLSGTHKESKAQLEILRNLVNHKVSYKHFTPKPSFFNFKARFFAFVANRSDWKALETNQKNNLLSPFRSAHRFAEQLNSLLPTTNTASQLDFTSKDFQQKSDQAFKLATSVGLAKYHDDLKHNSFEFGFGKLKRWALESFMQTNFDLDNWEMNQLVTHQSQKMTPWKSFKKLILGRTV